MSDVKKVLGVGHYTARWVQRSSLVELTATGLLPCFNYSAALEMRPERVFPPMWNMVFYTQDVCMTAVKPFSISQQFAMSEVQEGQSIIIHDATGEVEVPIEHDGAAALSPTSDGLNGILDDLYFVYARLPKNTGAYQGCVIAPVSSVVLGIYYRAYGPASKAECENWMATNCTEGDVIELAGGEIPWPLLA